jgi:hypothetical protein
VEGGKEAAVQAEFNNLPLESKWMILVRIDVLALCRYCRGNQKIHVGEALKSGGSKRSKVRVILISQRRRFHKILLIILINKYQCILSNLYLESEEEKWFCGYPEPLFSMICDTASMLCIQSQSKCYGQGKQGNQRYISSVPPSPSL